MADVDTVKSIRTNLKGILKTTLGYNFEDASGDPPAASTNLVQLHYKGEVFEDNYNESKKRNIISFLINVEATEKSKDAAEERAIEIVHELRAAITVNLVNVGDLASSKLVSWVSHEGGGAEVDTPNIQIEYPIEVRYAEL